MAAHRTPPVDNSPKHWKHRVRSAVLHAMALAHQAIMQTRSRSFTGRSQRRTRHIARIERLEAELALVREELRIKNTRMRLLAPQRRPHYRSVERMAILELRAARGWNLAQTAAAFLVTEATIRAWMQRIDEDGPEALVQLHEPVNKFPEFVGYVVRRLKVVCRALGKRKIAETLARAGLHLGGTTVGRMLERPTRWQPPAAETKPPQSVPARHVNHTWHVDLTSVPITSGCWVPWLPFALPQRWPFCWWLAVAVDQFSRRVMGLAVFQRQPDSAAVRAFLGRTLRHSGAAPKHLVCDRGRQFDCHGFRRWCGRRQIKVRYGAVGQHGSIAVVERAIRTLKELLRLLVLIPIRPAAFRQELSPQNRRGLAHFAESSEQNVPVPFSATVLG